MAARRLLFQHIAPFFFPSGGCNEAPQNHVDSTEHLDEVVMVLDRAWPINLVPHNIYGKWEYHRTNQEAAEPIDEANVEQ